MRDWHKKITLIFLPLLFICFLVIQEKKKADVIHKTSRSIASVPSSRPVVKTQESQKVVRKVAAIKANADKNNPLLMRVPQSIEETFQKNPGIRLSKGHAFLDDVAALPEDHFEPSLGNVIQKRDGLVYFRANPGHHFIPVAISKSTRTLYPVSSILHVKKASLTLRQNLINKGFTEYYYHPSLQLLSLKTKTGEVLKVYNQLRNEGLQVEMEVLKPGHQHF